MYLQLNLNTFEVRMYNIIQYKRFPKNYIYYYVHTAAHFSRIRAFSKFVHNIFNIFWK